MKLTPQALQKISEKRIRRRLADALDVTDQSVQNYIRDNKTNGPLTTYAALLVIKDELKADESEILEEVPGELAA